jgi:hypothetical protein
LFVHKRTDPEVPDETTTFPILPVAELPYTITRPPAVVSFILEDPPTIPI